MDPTEIDGRKVSTEERGLGNDIIFCLYGRPKKLGEGGAWPAKHFIQRAGCVTDPISISDLIALLAMQPNEGKCTTPQVRIIIARRQVRYR